MNRTATSLIHVHATSHRPLPRIPHFVFVARAHRPPRPSLADAWRRAIQSYFPAGGHLGPGEAYITVCEGGLEELDPAEARNDCIVSPANSFGIMDGGFDLELSRIFQPEGSSPDDPYALTDHVQAALRARWAGYAPPGSCTLVPLPAEVCGEGRNRWGTHTLAVLPTMKQPEWVGWNRELVYHGMWTLLCEIGRWNGDVDSGCPSAGGERGDGEGNLGEGRSDVGSGVEGYEAGKRREGRGIGRVLVTGLGTGTGGVDVELCGQQMVLAVKHYLEGVPEKARWESATVKRRVEEVEETLGEFSRSGI
ncbi:hypothetical protein GSI_15676 [Ganoderma sinense ZZ0214-1]|uniref:Macro-like domain-containing protein n=1 Tax=Ganoderma sinense ZZ0214-1 TaxID=1077348 RepID=A0A2G8RN91_9APHY|nr:hypothetical protein GSI_15676 [Ganoderma sinense ZZ0214-1]